MEPIETIAWQEIIDHGELHGGGWLSVIGKLAPTSLAKGAHVSRGQVIGQANKRRVYLEVRVEVSPGGVPVDPERLFE